MTRRLAHLFAASVLLSVGVACTPSQQDDIDSTATLDDELASDELRVKAEAGDAAAQSDLGFMYANGEGVPQDHAEAVRWWRLAADQGNAPAQSGLGIMYTNGRGVPQDDVQAYMWSNLAASRLEGETRDMSVELRDDVANRLPPEQRAEAQRLAREWDDAHPR